MMPFYWLSYKKKRLELTVSDEKETQNIFNERKVY